MLDLQPANMVLQLVGEPHHSNNINVDIQVLWRSTPRFWNSSFNNVSFYTLFPLVHYISYYYTHLGSAACSLLVQLRRNKNFTNQTVELRCNLQLFVAYNACASSIVWTNLRTNNPYQQFFPQLVVDVHWKILRLSYLTLKWLWLDLLYASHVMEGEGGKAR